MQQPAFAAPFPFSIPIDEPIALPPEPEPALLEGHPTANGVSPQKRKTPPNPTGSKPSKKIKKVGPRTDSMPNGGDGDNNGESSKPKRVRTGCLTCRERHLKCDEAWPNCQNCRKSSRECKRGIKLNFIDTWCDRPPSIVTLYGKPEWKVEFLDESREIADGYTGGTHKYLPLEQPVPTALQREKQQRVDMSAFTYATTAPPAPTMPPQPLPPIQGILPGPSYQEQGQQQQHSRPSVANPFEPQPIRQDPSQYSMQPPNSGSTMNSVQYAPQPQNHVMQQPLESYAAPEPELNEENEKRDFLNNAEETLFMQVFVEEVGLWMDSMDPLKHFSRLLPFHSLSEPMLLNAFLACGARHLTLVNPQYTEEKALHYYDTATRFLLKNLQNPNRDTVICATTAVILNVYEVMSERALQRMNHIAGARALIKECGWNARSTGIGAACFWLNVGLEVLSCLHFNWQVAWDPDDWLIDLNLSREVFNGREETWTHRMLYLVAKICNFRATMPRSKDSNPRDEQIRTQQRYEEWTRLKGLVDAWNDGIPRTMQPMAYVYPFQTSSKSCFPEVWLVKRTSIVARLFYHMAMLLLSQINPYMSVEGGGEMAELQTRHSQMICGITAHVKDRGVASIAIRSLAHAAEVLTSRREQEEVLSIFDKINKETGWRIGFVYKELKEKWGWHEEVSPQQYAQTHTAARQQKEAQEAQQQQQQIQQQAQQQQNMQMQPNFSVLSMPHPQQQMQMPQPQQQAPTPQQLPPSAGSSSSSASEQRKRPPSGIPNPMYAKADFNLPQHPYQNFYVAPTSGYGNPQGGFWWTNEAH